MVVAFALALAPTGSRAAEGTTGAAGATESAPTGTAGKAAEAGTKTGTKTGAKNGAKAAGKAARKKVAPRAKAPVDAKPLATRGKGSRAARLKAAREQQAHTINDDVEITPFPSHAAAARKALSQNRRDQLDDAEKAARDPHQSDRWQTVLFHLRGFDSRADAEACFWRVVAYYRLGEIGRARTIRQGCEIAAKDLPIIDKEDVQSAGLQPATALPELAAAGEKASAPVPNPAGYEGDSPTRLER
jgi:hypothetical protein